MQVTKSRYTLSRYLMPDSLNHYLCCWDYSIIVVPQSDRVVARRQDISTHDRHEMSFYQIMFTCTFHNTNQRRTTASSSNNQICHRNGLAISPPCNSTRAPRHDLRSPLHLEFADTHLGNLDAHCHQHDSWCGSTTRLQAASQRDQVSHVFQEHFLTEFRVRRVLP